MAQQHVLWLVKNNTNRVVNNTDGSIVGYKYFYFDPAHIADYSTLRLRLIPEGINGTIEILADRPWTSQGGKKIGQIDLMADMPKTSTELTARLDTVHVGLHALYFKFASETKEKSLCTLEDFVFE